MFATQQNCQSPWRRNLNFKYKFLRKKKLWSHALLFDYKKREIQKQFLLFRVITFKNELLKLRAKKNSNRNFAEQTKIEFRPKNKRNSSSKMRITETIQLQLHTEIRNSRKVLDVYPNEQAKSNGKLAKIGILFLEFSTIECRVELFMNVNGSISVCPKLKSGVWNCEWIVTMTVDGNVVNVRPDIAQRPQEQNWAWIRFGLNIIFRPLVSQK